MNSPQFCLGTAKLGDINYGFGSARSDRNINDFFEKCRQLDIYNFDTSPRYGESEKILGEYLSSLSNNKIFISTKVDNLVAKNNKSEDRIKFSLENSLLNLNIDKINILYLHQNNLEIISDKFILNSLLRLKEQGYVESIGASIYSEEELKFVMDCEIFDYVQIPIHILDTYFYNIIVRSKSKIRIVARSIFLQGLLMNLEKGKNIKPYNELCNAMKKLDKILKDYDLELRNVLISYIFSLNKLSSVITGTTSLHNLDQNFSNSRLLLNNEILEKLNNLSKDKALWTNPRYW